MPFRSEQARIGDRNIVTIVYIRAAQLIWEACGALQPNESRRDTMPTPAFA